LTLSHGESPAHAGMDPWWALLRRGTSRREVEQRWEHASTELVDALTGQKWADAAAERVRQEAVEADVAQARAEQSEARRAAHEQRMLRAAAELGISREDAARLPGWALDPTARRAMQASRGGSPAGGGGPILERDRAHDGHGSEGPERD